jgi:hypothetical protein
MLQLLKRLFKRPKAIAAKEPVAWPRGSGSVSARPSSSSPAPYHVDPLGYGMAHNQAWEAPSSHESSRHHDCSSGSSGSDSSSSSSSCDSSSSSSSSDTY